MTVPSSDGDELEQRATRVWVARLEGALLGVSLTALVATAGSSVGISWALGYLDLVAPALVIGGIVGFTTAARAIATQHPILVALGAALRAVLLGIVVVIFLSALLSIAGSGALDVGAVGWVAFLVLFGLVLGLPVTIPVALAAVAALRAGARRRWLPPLVIGAALLLAGVIAGVGGPGFPSVGSGGWALGEPVTLGWTVANRSIEPLVLFVGDPDPGSRSFGGWSQGLAGCFITTGESREANDWYLTLDRASAEDDLNFPAGPEESLVSAHQVPGTRASVWIEVASNGTQTVVANRPPPGTDELTVDLCREPPS